MQSDASAVPDHGSCADDDNHSPVDSVGDGTRPRSDSSASLTCPECGQTFRRREHLIRHLDRHSGRRSYTCDVCRRCVYQPNPTNQEAETIVVAQSATDDAASATHSSPSQQIQPLTPLSCVPLQPSINPELSWDTLLSSAQFLLPFSPLPSFEPGALADFCFGDAAFPTTGQIDHGEQNSFGAEAPQRNAVEAGNAFVGPENLTTEEEDILIAENIPHVPPVTEETRLYIIQAIQARVPQHEAQGLDVKFPSLRHLDTYMQLYFEHFHPRMPLLHVPTFQASPETWQLVLSVHTLLISAEWSVMVESQFYRNTLVTLCRLLLSRESTLMHTPESTEDLDHAWFQWIQVEAKRRLVHFAYIPIADRYWSSSCEQWHLLPPPQPSPTLCVLLSRVGLGDIPPSSLEQLTQSAILFSASLQQAAERDLLRAMEFDSTSNTASRPSPSLGMASALSQKAFDALSQVGCSQALHELDASGGSNGFALLSRVLVILSFTPLSLLFSYNKWQTTDVGQSNARSELLNTVLQNTSRARRCLYYSAQVLQHFRIARPATVLEIMGCLVSVLYMILYVDVIEQQDHDSGRYSAGGRMSSMDIIRLDQVVDGDVLNDWLQVGTHKRLHVSGVGFLHSDGSILRLYKEGWRILARGSRISKMAKVISSLLESQAHGYSLSDKTFREL
ncbi:hypothetical protein FANTH_9989 [Fusarium anthophilum]|uniref:C2H2-type domain-containing protein n=1 Tax=Fusarium anthophilum TaxID=48485 RepID=A0A8H5DXE2_9HYPO|nr:hypothetical protein FANTH_9989 [Fusarium anthophilum]